MQTICSSGKAKRNAVIAGLALALACSDTGDGGPKGTGGTGNAGAGAQPEAGADAVGGMGGGGAADGGAPEGGSATGGIATGGVTTGGVTTGGVTTGGVTTGGVTTGGVTTGGVDGGSAGAGGEGGAMPVEDPDCPFVAPEDTSLGFPGDLVFNAPCNAVGKGLFRVDDRLYWRYELDGRSFIVGGYTDGTERDLLAVVDEPISFFDVRGSIVFQTGPRVFTIPRPSGRRINLGASPICAALSSTSEYVYCRSYEQTILRWPALGGAPTVIASELKSGLELLADERSDRLFYVEEARAIASIPLSGVVGGGAAEPAHPIAEPAFWPFGMLPRPSGLRLLPGDNQLHWLWEGLQDAFPSAVIATIFYSGTLQDDAVSSVRSLLRRTRPNDPLSRLPILPVYTPFPPWGMVLVVERADGSAGFLPSQAFMVLDYSSQDGMVALTSERARLFWQDRKGRVFRGAPKWPDAGYTDGFTSSLDEKRISALSESEARTVCEELVAYVERVPDSAFIRADCTRVVLVNESATTAAECEAQTDRCVLADPVAEHLQKNITFDACMQELTVDRHDCDAPIVNYTGCYAARTDALINYVQYNVCAAAEEPKAPFPRFPPASWSTHDCDQLNARCPRP